MGMCTVGGEELGISLIVESFFGLLVVRHSGPEFEVPWGNMDAGKEAIQTKSPHPQRDGGPCSTQFHRSVIGAASVSSRL